VVHARYPLEIVLQQGGLLPDHRAIPKRPVVCSAPGGRKIHSYPLEQGRAEPEQSRRTEPLVRATAGCFRPFFDGFLLHARERDLVPRHRRPKAAQRMDRGYHGTAYQEQEPNPPAPSEKRNGIGPV
jgi:hypothetical protein